MLPSRAAALRAKKRRSVFISQPNPTQLATIAVLMILGLSIQPNPPQRGVGPDLARTRNAQDQPGAERADAQIVSIARDGKLYLGTSQTDAAALAPQLRNNLINSFDKKVYLRPDARAKYGDVTRVIDQLQLSGVTSVAFLTEKRRTPPQHP